jgi:hypothetical protein
MRTHAVILAVISLGAAVGLSRAADDTKEEAVKKELRPLKGMWKPIAREVDGKKISEEELKDVTVTYEESGKLMVRRGDTRGRSKRCRTGITGGIGLFGRRDVFMCNGPG